MASGDIVKLRNWSTCVTVDDPYWPPEKCGTSVQGRASGPAGSMYDGRHVKSSRIVHVQGRKVWTESGTLYVLGRIDPKFREYLRTERPDWDWRRPITLLSPGGEA